MVIVCCNLWLNVSGGVADSTWASIDSSISKDSVIITLPSTVSLPSCRQTPEKSIFQGIACCGRLAIVTRTTHVPNEFTSTEIIICAYSLSLYYLYYLVFTLIASFLIVRFINIIIYKFSELLRTVFRWMNIFLFSRIIHTYFI